MGREGSLRAVQSPWLRPLPVIWSHHRRRLNDRFMMRLHVEKFCFRLQQSALASYINDASEGDTQYYIPL